MTTDLELGGFRTVNGHVPSPVTVVTFHTGPIGLHIISMTQIVVEIDACQGRGVIITSYEQTSRSGSIHRGTRCEPHRCQHHLYQSSNLLQPKLNKKKDRTKTQQIRFNQNSTKKIMIIGTSELVRINLCITASQECA